MGPPGRKGVNQMNPHIEFIVRIVITIFCLGLVVVIHEWGHLMMAIKLGVRVERFTVGFGPEILGWTSKRKIRYAVCVVPLGGMVKMAGEFMEERHDKPDEFFSQPWYRRNLIALAGPIMNYVLAFILFALVAGVWGILQPSDQPIVGDIIPGLPAAVAKLQENDRIISINGAAVGSWDDMAKTIHEHPAEQLNVVIERPSTNGQAPRSVNLVLTPQRDSQLGIGLIGIMPKVNKVKPGFKGSLGAAYRDVKVWTFQPLNYLSSKIRHFEGPKELSGPLGIAQMVTKATRDGLSYVIYLIAIISTGLGLFNLFPIPVLDGGHILLYTIEGILRRPLSRRTMQVAHAIGLSLVLTIFLYASYQDVLRWRLGFWK
jgi:regulator of sigma E protease